MALAAGTRLGPYEILAPLGEGGMGEVYKARDVRLERIVAIKALPPRLADRADLRTRFDVEARAIASLNHPHICILHDIGEQEGVHFLVMEYLEGETLAQRLSKGPLPLAQALACAVQVADALDKAHRTGATHRDVKPGNIMLTRGGAKLLDFGLAKLKQEVFAQPNVLLSQLAAPPSALTSEGTLLGTLQYMAPEQIEGRVAQLDARTDVFAFGAVLYEMVTGRKAFDGKSSASIIAEILAGSPPPLTSLQPIAPPQLDRVVQKCLAKEPDGRWQSAADLRDELQWIAQDAAQASSRAATPTPAALRRFGVLAALACSAAAVVGGLTAWRLKPAPAPASLPVSRLQLSLLPNERLAAQSTAAVALSPDGTRLAYVARRGPTPQLFLRELSQPEGKPVAESQGASNPTFSEDGQWLAFVADRKLKKVSVSGGVPVTLGPANAFGATWALGDRIVVPGAGPSRGLFEFAATGGAARELTVLDAQKGERMHNWPNVLPGGKAVLFTVPLQDSARWDDSLVVVQSLETGARKTVVQGGTDARYVPTGHVVYLRSGTLMAVPFDASSLEVTGTPTPVVEGVMQSSGGGGQYSFSQRGDLVYVPGAEPERTLAFVDRHGAARDLPLPPAAYLAPRLSPDGRRIVIWVTGANCNILVHDIAREASTRLTDDADNHAPLWTPDGKRIVFTSTKAGPRRLFWVPADGSGPNEALSSGPSLPEPSSISPDGRVLAYVELDPTTRRDIWLLPLAEPRTPRVFLQTSFNELMPIFSPDGRSMAYVSDQSGRSEVYVQAYPGPGERWQISPDGGTEPVWSHDGRELFYRNLDRVMVVAMGARPGAEPGKPTLLFRAPYLFSADLPTLNGSRQYDVTPDGRTLLMVKSGERELAPAQILVVVNWFEELKRLVPPRR
jgi:eukaryotic-like serine/threonine-protein kinase